MCAKCGCEVPKDERAEARSSRTDEQNTSESEGAFAFERSESDGEGTKAVA